MKRAGDWIPANVLAAAKRAGLTTPLWYVGRSRGPVAPRKKTLADLERDARGAATRRPTEARRRPDGTTQAGASDKAAASRRERRSPDLSRGFDAPRALSVELAP